MTNTTAKIWVPTQHFKQVNRDLKVSGVKFYPFLKYSRGYEIEFEPADHPLVTFLLLKFDDIKVVD